MNPITIYSVVARLFIRGTLLFRSYVLFSTIKLEFKLESRTSEFVCVFFFLRLLLLLYWLSFSGVTICLLYRFRQIIHNLFIFMDFLNIVEKETKKEKTFFPRPLLSTVHFAHTIPYTVLLFLATLPKVRRKK